MLLFLVHKQASAHLNFGPLCTYLSISYLDRFLSAYELPVSKQHYQIAFLGANPIHILSSIALNPIADYYHPLFINLAEEQSLDNAIAGRGMLISCC